MRCLYNLSLVVSGMMECNIAIHDANGETRLAVRGRSRN